MDSKPHGESPKLCNAMLCVWLVFSVCVCGEGVVRICVFVSLCVCVCRFERHGPSAPFCYFDDIIRNCYFIRVQVNGLRSVPNTSLLTCVSMFFVFFFLVIWSGFVFHRWLPHTSSITMVIAVRSSWCTARCVVEVLSACTPQGKMSASGVTSVCILAFSDHQSNLHWHSLPGLCCLFIKESLSIYSNAMK